MSSKNTAEKKAPSTPTSTKSKKDVASSTPRSTAMAAMPFYSSVGEASLPKMDEETKNAMKARAIVNTVFTNDEQDKAGKRHLENAFDYPPFTESDMSKMAEIEFLKGRKRDDLEDLEKMEMAVSMANRGQEMARMSPDQMEIEVAHELLDLKQAAPTFEREIGDRSTPIPDIEEDLFVSSAENTPVRRSKRKKGGMPKAGTHEKMRKDQKNKFIELLERTESWNDVNSRYKAYLREDGAPDLLSKEDKLVMFNVTEKAILDDMGARRGGGKNFTTDIRTKRAHMKKKQAEKFYELLHYHASFDDADKAFQEYVKQKRQPELINKEHRLNIFVNFESGIADEFDLESHIVRSTGGKRTRRTRRRRRTIKKRHLKKGTKSRKTKRRKRRTLKK